MIFEKIRSKGWKHRVGTYLSERDLRLKSLCIFLLIYSQFSALDVHDTDTWICRAKCKSVRCMSHIHAKNAARHVADNADKVAWLVVEDAHLVSASTSCHYQILFAVEHCCVEHRSWLRFELLHMILFIICNIYFLNNMTILFYVGFSTIETIPFVSSGALHRSDIIQLEGIILSIAASEHSIAVVSDVYGIPAHVRPKDTSDRALFSNVVDLHGVVPSAR